MVPLHEHHGCLLLPAVEIRLIAAAKSRFMGLHLFSCRGSVGVLNATSSNESPCRLAWNSEGCSQGGGSIHADLAAALTAVSRADYVVCGTLRDGKARFQHALHAR